MENDSMILFTCKELVLVGMIRMAGDLRWLDWQE